MSTAKTEKDLKIRCPRCGASAPWEGNPDRPFCSERCRLIDLGNWADESYRIPSGPVPPESETSEDEE